MDVSEVVVGHSPRVSVDSLAAVYRCISDGMGGCIPGCEIAWVVFDSGGDILFSGAHDPQMFDAIYPSADFFEEWFRD